MEKIVSQKLTTGDATMQRMQIRSLLNLLYQLVTYNSCKNEGQLHVRTQTRYSQIQKCSGRAYKFSIKFSEKLDFRAIIKSISERFFFVHCFRK